MTNINEMPVFTSPMKEIPIIGGSKKDREKERLQKLLQEPTAANALNKLANELAKNFDSKVQLMVDLRVNATFTDTMSGKVYKYEYFAIPITHDIRVVAIMELAKKPLDEFPRDHMMVIYDANANPSPRYLITTIDFCKYVATGIWVINDLNVDEEKKFLDDIKK